MGDEAYLEALKQSLSFTGEFRRSLAKEPVRTIQEALQRAIGYMTDEEELRAFQAKYARATTSRPPPSSAQPASKGRTPTGRYVNHEETKGNHNYVIDQPEEGECYLLEKETTTGGEHDGGRGRGRGRNNGGRGRGRSNVWLRRNEFDENAYCDHHGTVGHSTANCKVLGAILAKDLAEGKLGNFSVKDFARPRDDKPDPGQPQGEPKRDRANDVDQQGGPRQRINVIMGGSQHCSDTVPAIEAYQRRAVAASYRTDRPRLSPYSLSFSERDGTGIDQPHNDHLVAELAIGNYLAKVLFDTGSSVDMIFTETLRRMKIDPSSIDIVPRPLTGFSGQTTMTIGTINLPVEAGGLTRMVKFSVANHPAVYDAILGTPWLSTMRAAVSVYHMCVKFPSSSGVRTIWGSQEQSRICLLAEHRLRHPARNDPEDKKQVRKHRMTDRSDKSDHPPTDILPRTNG